MVKENRKISKDIFSYDGSPEIGERMILFYSYEPSHNMERYSSDAIRYIPPSMEQNFLIPAAG
ncbi:hypothetical protein DLD82_15110 [Methanospirillum stamsii]|uniref:Uncharacterized protein n=1 Tax=Methanospirillum stamsii TaxID=1277351 RepID=A0A2V2N3N2_9EURY|nr:hypothetical protein DLD82_15110 [Methanospirillum stamsii]